MNLLSTSQSLGTNIVNGPSYYIKAQLFFIKLYFYCNYYQINGLAFKFSQEVNKVA